MPQPVISVITPTLDRPTEVGGLLENLNQQTLLPQEIIVVDGAPASNAKTEKVVAALSSSLRFACRYVRHERGTAVQRNRGVEEALPGSFIAFVDDDVRLAPAFLERILEVFQADEANTVGGVVGYRINQRFDLNKRRRWRWYRHLQLLSTFEPGRYDFSCGYPINADAQPQFSGVRSVDFMTTACAVWRREVFDTGLRFDPFFSDYGILEDAHFSLRAGLHWKLLQCGDAHCTEMHSPNGRIDSKKIGLKSVVNYYYVFKDVAGPLTRSQKMRFWRFQLFELLRIATSAVQRRRWADVENLQGRFAGMIAIGKSSAARRLSG